MEQNNTKINYYVCIGLYDFTERGISFGKSVYDLTLEDLNHINYMYCRSLSDGSQKIICQNQIKSVLSDPNIFLVNKYNGFYDHREFYTLSEIYNILDKNRADDSVIESILEDVSFELNRGNKVKKIK